MPGILSRVLLPVALVFCSSQAALAQQISGHVLDVETLQPVPGATVNLLDDALSVQGHTVTDSLGTFAFDSPSGAYVLQAEAGGRFTPLLPVNTADQGAMNGVRLLLPSGLLGLSNTCPSLYETWTVLAGIIHDRQTGVALPGAHVTAEWTDGPRDVPTATTDAAGRYRFCGVPVNRPVRLHVSAFGRTATQTIDVPGVHLARADIGVDLGAGASSLRILAVHPLPADAANSTISGRILDIEERSGLADAAVRVHSGDATAVSAVDGGFELKVTDAGEVVLEVQHLAYGTHREVVVVPAAARVEVELLLAPRALTLEAVEVLGRSAIAPAVRSSTTRFDGFMGTVLAAAESRGDRVVELVRTLPGVTVMEGRFTTPFGLVNGVCLTTSRRLATLRPPPDGSPDAPWCDPVPVYVDDVPAGDAINFLRSLSVANYESIQLLHPAEAHIRYGLAAGAAGGALVLWTRGRGPYVSQQRNIDHR